MAYLYSYEQSHLHKQGYDAFHEQLYHVIYTAP